MRSRPAHNDVLGAQCAWAERHDLEPDPRGYLARYELNLRDALSPAALTAFQNGSGAELIDRAGHAAKMRALHSSSALAVNVFDFWTERVQRDGTRILRALGTDGGATRLEFERKLPTGARGTPPNIDVVITRDDTRLIGVESKFTEWMSPKEALATSLHPYVNGGASFWLRAALPATHQLVEGMLAGEEVFRYLDVPQLLKHALGLTRKSAPGWELRYLYFDALCAARNAHSSELDRFQAAVGSELRFRAITYQAFVDRLQPPRDEEEVAYFEYLSERYFRV